MKIVAVTGPDGSGKSTVCKIAQKRLEIELGSVVQVSIWDAIEEDRLFASKADVVSYLSDLEGATRTLFLFHAMSRSLDLARRKNPQLALVEGYWYKYAVTEMGQGVSPEIVLSAAQGFEVPLQTISLDVDPEVAWLRRQDPSSYEQGVLTEGSKTERFLKFQRSLIPLWKQIENKYGPWIHISTLNAPEEVANSVAQFIVERFKKE